MRCYKQTIHPMLRYFSVLSFFITLSTFLSSQNLKKIDSLNKVLSVEVADTSKAKLLSRIAHEYRVSKPDTSVLIIEKALLLVKDANNELLLTKLMQDKANFIYWQAKYDEATEILNECLKVYKARGLKKNMAGVYFDLGNISKNTGKISSAVPSFLEALKLYEQVNDLTGQATCYGALSQTYRYKNDLSKSVDYAKKELSIYENLKSFKGIGHSLTDLGILYSDLGQYDKAAECLTRSIEYKKKIGDILGVGINLNNLSSVTLQLKNYKLALEQLNEALEIFKNANSDYWMGIAKVNICALYNETKEYDKALSYCNESIEAAGRVKFIELEKEATKLKAEIHYAQNKFKEAFDDYKHYTLMKDSMFNEASNKQIEEANAKFETEKKDKELLEKNSQIKLQNLEADKNKVQKIYLLSGIAVLLVFVWFVYNRLRLTRSQKLVIEKQKLIVEERNQEVKESITYAKRLQEAILPSQALIHSYFPESFVLYMPKDIVAGDFFWMELVQLNDMGVNQYEYTWKNHDSVVFKATRVKVLLAVADSTGHGVPGAMVSVVCSTALNRAVKEFALTDPGQILGKTRELVVETFEKSGSEVKDGMDISLICVDMPFSLENEGNLKIEWAGANIPLWYTTNGELHELLPNKQPIGKHMIQEPFRTHKFEIPSGEQIYLFSDGFADQFGGEKGKKFMYKRMKDVFLHIRNSNMNEQGEALKNTIESWKGKLEQVDDICVISIRT